MSTDKGTDATGTARLGRTRGYVELHARTGGQESDPLLGYEADTNSVPQQLKKSNSTTQKTRQMKRIKEIQNEKSVFRNLFHKGPDKARVSSKTRSSMQRDTSEARTFNSSESSSSRKHKHSFLFSMLNPFSQSIQAYIFKTFIGIVILVDLAIFIASNSEKFEMPYAEGIVSSIFLIEYLLRLVTITESRKYSHPVWGRLAFMRTYSAIVDILATLPWFLELFSGWELPTLTFLRFFRLVRILKTDGYTRAMDSVYRVVYYNAEILYVASLLCIYLVLFTAVLLYYFRPSTNDNPQFDSIASTMYLSALILTGQGGPDEEGLPWYTRAIVLVTSVFSIPMFAIPASMLTWGFEAEAERMAKQSRKRAIKKREKQKGQSSSGQVANCSSSSTSSFDSDENTTDEEYFKLIAGEEEDDSDSKAARDRELREQFISSDGNQDGSLTLSEFISLSDKYRSNPAIAKRAATGDLEQRLLKVERAMAENTIKLDRILQLLEKPYGESARVSQLRTPSVLF
ncbi:hypothetical protein ACA910_012496 [Epithemia clementina (nom. ined.)]